MRPRELGIAGAAAAGWYLLAYLMVHPLANAPVVDSWIYAHAVRVFVRTGGLRFVGFTQAMPVTQVLYGAAWSRMFGASAVSLDIACAFLGALGVVLFYALLRRCGAGIAAASVAAAILAANPCYLFLSFSFMTEIPFVFLMIAAFLTFALARGRDEIAWLWVSAALSVAAFMVRPFAAAALVGFGGAILLYDRQPRRFDREWLERIAPRLAPFGAALVLCAAAWAWLTMLRPQPWSLQRSEHHIAYLFDVRPLTYLRAGLIGPLLYLGLVTSPLAGVQLIAQARGDRRRLRRGAAIAGGLFALTWILVEVDSGRPATPELSCWGGWDNALLVHGLPTHFRWNGVGQWIAAAIGSLGAAGLIAAAPDALRKLGRAGAAIVIAAACYWIGTLPLWLFNDRYYLILVPAAALLAALAPARRQRLPGVPAMLAMTAAMAWLSLAGVYDYQRGSAALIAARDALERRGVPRSAIDAGYALNGAELYRYLDQSEDTYKQERGIPMITAAALDEYTIAGAPLAGTTVVWRTDWPGPFGFGRRELYVLRKVPPPSHPVKSAQREEYRKLRR